MKARPRRETSIGAALLFYKKKKNQFFNRKLRFCYVFRVLESSDGLDEESDGG